MPLTVSITQQDVYAALGAFVTSVVPAGVAVIQLPVDRAAMPPPVPGFVGMTANLQTRIMTNLDRWNPANPAPVAINIEQAIKLTVKLDCYGPAAADWAVMLSTVLRDEYGVDSLAPTLAPLYTEMPRFMPLTNAEEQYEQRWIVEAQLQYNPVITTPMQFANAANADLINVDVSYPP